MFCTKCGAKLLESSKFCTSCGASLANVNKETIKPPTFETIEPSVGNEIVERSEVIIQSYIEKYARNLKITVICNGNYIGKIKRNESIILPIYSDSMLEFKSSIWKERINVKSGEISEVKLEFDRLNGKLRVFDLHSEDSMVQLEKLKKRNKKVRRALPILAIFVLLLCAFDGYKALHMNLLTTPSQTLAPDLSDTYTNDTEKIVTESPYLPDKFEKTADTIQKESTPATEETASILTKEEAEDLLVEWMSDHPFPVSVLYMAEPDSELNGDDYYVFGFYEELPDDVNRYTDIYISRKNAEMFSSEFYNKTLEPLNDWYMAFIPKLQEDIDKKNAIAVGETIELSNDELTELNIFLSNFLEASLWSYSEEFTSDSELIQFAYLHNLINNPSRLKLEEFQDSPHDYYDAIDGSHIVNTIDRFFDREVSLFSFDSYIYKDGKLYSPAADGGFFGYFAQVREVVDYKDGTYGIDFDFYETEYFYQGEKAFYEPESTWDGETRTHASPNGTTGYALVKKVTINDRQTYQLITLE